MGHDWPDQVYGGPVREAPYPRQLHAPGGFNPGLSDDPERKSFVDTYIANCPLGCWANEDDIKGPIVFLASEAANYVTGATIVMDGGWTIW